MSTRNSGTRVIILDDAGAVHRDGGLNWHLDRSFAGKDIKLRVVGHASKRTRPSGYQDEWLSLDNAT
jgi:hypothetical protein